MGLYYHLVTRTWKRFKGGYTNCKQWEMEEKWTHENHLYILLWAVLTWEIQDVPVNGKYLYIRWSYVSKEEKTMKILNPNDIKYIYRIFTILKHQLKRYCLFKYWLNRLEKFAELGLWKNTIPSKSVKHYGQSYFQSRMQTYENNLLEYAYGNQNKRKLFQI